MRERADPVVHLELRTTNLPRACSFYTRLFGWRVEKIEACGASYVALDVGPHIEGGVVEVEAGQARWRPYVEVADVAQATAHGRLLGGSVLLEPREGPGGWRSVIATPDGGEIALWQPKQCAPPHLQLTEID